MYYIGNHLSASKGFAAMGREAVKLGGNTFAFFTRNPRGGKAKAIDEKDIEKFLAFAKEHEFGKIVAHAPYTMNLCSAKEDIRNFSKEMIADDMKRMEYIPGNYYNFHPGSHTGQGVETGIEYIAQTLNEIITPEQSTTILLETMAGKGSEIGRNFDKVIGLDRLKAVHFNDSMNVCGSHKDRHQKIGQGNIGLEAMKRAALHPILKGKPFILETPNDNEGYAAEIAMFKEWMCD